MSRWDPSRVVYGRVTAPPGVCDTSAASWSPDADCDILYGCRFVALWYDKLLTGYVGSIPNDVHCGSYLEFILFVFRKFAGRDSGSIPRVLR